MKYYGLSLIEIMLGLFLSTCMLSLLIHHYINLKQQYITANEFIEQALELKWTEELLRNSIKRAGFTPCINLNKLRCWNPQNLQPLKAISIDFEPHQILNINRMSENFFESQQLSSNSLLLPSNEHIKLDKAIIIADCYHAEIGEIHNTHISNKQSFIYLKNTLHFKYSAPVYVGAWLHESFFIRQNRLHQPALYYKSSRIEELTKVIKNWELQLLTKNDMTLVKIILTLGNSQPLIIKTTVRSG